MLGIILGIGGNIEVVKKEEVKSLTLKNTFP